MNEFEFRESWPQWLLVASLLVLVLCLYANARRRAVLSIFGLDTARAGAWLRACARRRWLRAVLATLALLLVAFAALGPRADPEKTRISTNARDIAIIVDVSRSMLAEDLRPNRLERAKLQIARLCDSLKGDRVGLIAFAGTARILCPMTSDYNYFKGELNYLAPDVVEQGGTQIGRAIRKALGDLFGLESPDTTGDDESETGEVGRTVLEDAARKPTDAYFDILLITDGENHGYAPEIAIRDAAKHGVGLYVVGIGSAEGTPIPVKQKDGTTELLRHEGEIVKTRLDSEGLLRLVDAAAKGAYLPAGTDNFDLVEFYRRTLGAESGREVFEEHVVWKELFQPFLLAGLFLYILYLVVPVRPRRESRIAWNPTEPPGADPAGGSDEFGSSTRDEVRR